MCTNVCRRQSVCEFMCVCVGMCERVIEYMCDCVFEKVYVSVCACECCGVCVQHVCMCTCVCCKNMYLSSMYVTECWDIVPLLKRYFLSLLYTLLLWIVTLLVSNFINCTTPTPLNKKHIFFFTV